MSEEFGFENEAIRGSNFEKYKGKKGETHRIGIVFEVADKLFRGKKVHFKEKYFVCTGKTCCKVLGPAKTRIVATIIKYNTDRTGVVTKPFGYEILPWNFSENAFLKLKTLNSEYPLTEHDIKISCTNQDYQHLDFSVCKESLWQANETLKKQILKEAAPVTESSSNIAPMLTEEEIKDLLGVAVQGPAADATTDIDLNSVLDNV